MADGERGMDCVLKVGGTIVGIMRDVDPDYSAGSIDVTKRSSLGWREKKQGLKEWTIDGEMLWIPTDASLQAVWNAYINATELTVEWLDSADYGRSGSAIVVDFHPGPQGLEDAVMCAVSLEGTAAPTSSTPAT